MTGVGHDYDPAWDYTLDQRPPKAVVGVVEARMEELGRVAAALGLETPRCYYVRDLSDHLGEHLARYINGTASAPVFVLDARALQIEARRSELSLQEAVVPTLWHELGHAWLESCGLELEGSEEELVEEFARRCWYDGSDEGVAWLQQMGASMEALG